ncbi:MAG: hypothetical protein K2G24_03865, partial [Muribaculaceae bacterium]|nr:hypothetical protein [Muribaculaceae bacterium]
HLRFSYCKFNTFRKIHAPVFRLEPFMGSADFSAHGNKGNIGGSMLKKIPALLYSYQKKHTLSFILGQKALSLSPNSGQHRI